MTPAERGGMLCDWRNRYGAWPGKDVTPENSAFQQGFECGLAHARGMEPQSMITTREQRRQLQRDNEKFGEEFVAVPMSQWPACVPDRLTSVLRSRDFLVQVFAADHPAAFRLSIARTSHNGERFEDGISWDDLQRIKNECGYRNCDAVEIFPSEDDKVDVANMRHLWVMAAPLTFAWRKK